MIITVFYNSLVIITVFALYSCEYTSSRQISEGKRYRIEACRVGLGMHMCFQLMGVMHGLLGTAGMCMLHVQYIGFQEQIYNYYRIMGGGHGNLLKS